MRTIICLFHVNFCQTQSSKVIHAQTRVSLTSKSMPKHCFTPCLPKCLNGKICGKVIPLSPMIVNMLFIGLIKIVVTHCSVGCLQIGFTPRQPKSPPFFQTSIQPRLSSALFVCTPVILSIQFKPSLTMMPAPSAPTWRAHCLSESNSQQHHRHW